MIENTYDSFYDSFLHLLKKAEGFSKSFYADNKGVAVGYGYNPTQNDINYNKNILDYAGVDETTQNKILANSKKFKNMEVNKVPEEFKNISLTTEQINKMALYSKKTYENDFVLKEKINNKNYSETKKNSLINQYQSLPDNQKAVLTHMTYKVGKGGLAKYNTFFNNFIIYLDKPTLENKQKVANSFIYHYRKNGKMLSDTRVSDMHANLFMHDAPKKEVLITKKINKPEKELTQDEKFNIATEEIKNQISFSGLKNYLIEKHQEQLKTKGKKSSNTEPSYLTNESDEDNVDYYEDCDNCEIVIIKRKFKS